MKKLCLTFLLVLFMVPALASAADAPADDKAPVAENVDKKSEAKAAGENGDNSDAGKNGNNSDAGAADEKADKAKKLADLKQKAEEAKATEQSLENKMLGAVGIGATGIGGMQLAQGLAEKNADAEAEAAMKAYLATFTCEYGGGRIAGGTQNVELPGTNLLTPLIMEYKELAADLKSRKEALDMTPGIESEVVLDAAMVGLHNNVNTGKTGGAYTSLARALSGDANAAAAWDAQKQESAKQVKTGAIVAGVGAAGSLIGNVALNGELGEKIKDLKAKKASKKSEENANELKKKLTDAGMENVDKLDLSKLDLSDAGDLIKKLDFGALKKAIKENPSQINKDATKVLNTSDSKSFSTSLGVLFGLAESGNKQ